MSKADMADVDQKWKVEQDLRSLVEAAEINKDPKRHQVIEHKGAEHEHSSTTD
jgi:hypothetical protein